jgi:type IV conjugative transfer system coupling protein TraD
MNHSRYGQASGFTSGGQIIHHYLKMMWEVLSKIFWLMFFISFTVWVVLVYLQSNKLQFISALNHYQAWWVVDISDAPTARQVFFDTDFSMTMVVSSLVWNNPTIGFYAKQFYANCSFAATVATVVFAVLYALVFLYLFKKGRSFNEERFVRGAKLVNEDEAKDIVKSRVGASHLGALKIGSIPIPSAWEPQSFMLIGGPGTGKSVLTAEWIAQLRKQKKKALILDRSGGFVGAFYDPKKDIIINPYDTRTASWSVFKECHADYHYSFIANTLIEKSDKESPFWSVAARLVFKSLLMREAVSQSPSLNNLMDTIMRCSLEQMVSICAGTDAASVFDAEGLKMAQSIRSVMASEVEILRVIGRDNNQTFSVREWVKQPGEGFIFLTTLKEQEEALRPFMTLIVDLFMNSVLTLEPDMKRRIWGIFDELQSLGRLKSLPPYLAESRKYGGCCLAGFQGYSQAKRIYGDEGVEELSDLFATFIVMRCNGNKTAEWSAKQLGKADNIEVNESLSFGLNTARDGANLQNSRRERDVVLSTELQNLEDLCGFVRFGKDVPIARFKLVYEARKRRAEGFILDEGKIRQQLATLAVFPAAANAESAKNDAQQDGVGAERSAHRNDLFTPSEHQEDITLNDAVLEGFDAETDNQLTIVDTFSDYNMER